MERNMQYRQQFDRIRLLDFMTGDLVSFAAGKYGDAFFDFVDMNCGAVPEGDFENVIDQNSQKEFIALYTGIALKRFGLVCGKIMDLGENYSGVLKDYFFRQGKSLGIPAPETVEDAFSLVQSCVLDGMPGAEIEFVSRTENLLEWKKNVSQDAGFWNFMASFMAGIFDGSGIAFSLEANSVFCVKKV